MSGAEYLRLRSADPETEDFEARMADARKQDSLEQAARAVGLRQEQEDERMGVASAGAERGGRNLAVALYNGARYTAETALDAAVPARAKGIAQANQPEGAPEPDVDLADVFPDFIKQADQWRDRMTEGNTGVDDVMIGIGQFAVPFTGWLKAFGAAKAATAAGKVGRSVAADTMTNLTAWDTQQTRFSDLLRMVAPDNGLVNAYADYLMADPEDSDAEGRWKNVVDGVVSNTLIGGFLWAAGKTIVGIGNAYRKHAKTKAANKEADAALGGMETDPTLSPEHAQVEGELAAWIREDPERAYTAYANIPESQGGKVITADIARELSPAYLKDRTLAAVVHEPASALAKAIYARALARAPKAGQAPLVLITSGGTGSGKTTLVRKMLPEIDAKAQIVLDTNLDKFASAVKKIDQAVAAGKEVHIAHVYRDIQDAFEHGMLSRAERQAAEHGTGRIVRIREHMETHYGSNETVMRLVDHYANNAAVNFSFIDNSLGRGKATITSPGLVPILKRSEYNIDREELIETVQRARAEGRISEGTAQGVLAGEDLQQGGSGVRPGAGGQLEPERAGRSGRQDPAAVLSDGQAPKADPIGAAFATPAGARLRRRLTGGGERGAPRVFRRDDPGTGRGDVTHTQDPEVNQAIRAVGGDPPESWKEVPPEGAEAFAAKLRATYDASPIGKQVTPLSAEALQGHRMFMADSGQAGVAISPQGELVGLWKDPGSHKLVTISAIQLGVENGGRFLNAFDTSLAQLYSRMGFKEVTRIKFADEFAPPGWDFEKLGRPDIVFMRHDPTAVGTKYQAGSDYSASYDEALERTQAAAPPQVAEPSRSR